MIAWILVKLKYLKTVYDCKTNEKRISSLLQGRRDNNINQFFKYFDHRLSPSFLKSRIDKNINLRLKYFGQCLFLLFLKMSIGQLARFWELKILNLLIVIMIADFLFLAQCLSVLIFKWKMNFHNSSCLVSSCLFACLSSVRTLLICSSFEFNISRDRTIALDDLCIYIYSMCVSEFEVDHLSFGLDFSCVHWRPYKN